MRALFLTVIIIAIAIWLTPFIVENPVLIAVAAVSLALLILASTNIEAGLLILLFVIPFSRQVSLAEAGGGAPVDFGSDDFFIVCLFIIWLVYLGKSKQAPFVASPLTWPFLAYFGACLLSFIPMMMSGKGYPVLSFLHLVKWYEYVFIYFVLVKYLERRDQVIRFLILALVSCALVAIFQAAQITIGIFTGKTTGFTKWATSSFESNGILGAFYVFFLSIVVSLLVRVRRPKIRILLIIFAGLLSFTLFYTFARAAYLGMVVSLMVLGFFHRRRALFLGIIMLCLLPAVFSRAVSKRVAMTVHIDAKQMRQMQYQNLTGKIPYQSQKRLQLILDQSSRERLINWARSRNIVYHHPVFGTGYWSGRYLGTFGFSTAHNFYLTVLIETGILGLLTFLWMGWSLVSRPLFFSYRTKDPLYDALGKGFAAGFTGILVHCFFGETFEAFRLTGPLWMMAGVVFAAIRIDESRQNIPESTQF
ncbi:MAG: O-antigen ligase family protein [Candidatus Omnitrophica bacterium]|nr:O-antigen ligase family protein [Candidatus Omnitrophota bacterium]